MQIILNKVRSLFNPEIYQGWGKRQNYFEGWYFKVIDQNETCAFAIIPGVAMDDKGNRHSFIQVLDGKRKTSQYHKFNFTSFFPDPERFLISIDNNHFSDDSVSLDLPELKGKLCFSGNIPWPKSLLSPGIMGPYSFVPFMECYHGIVSLDHSISGDLTSNGQKISFNGGRGYIEKDWGSSFPDAYIWMQSNHFKEPSISVKVSVARIPWLRGSFTGFIAGFWLKDKLISFTTYNKSILKRLYTTGKSVELVIENKTHRLEIGVVRDLSTSLASPVKGLMEGRIEESMTSVIDVSLINYRSGEILFKGKGRNAAVEVAGKVDEILV